MRLAALLLLSFVACAQPSCPPTPVFSPCELVIELDAAEAKAHPNPYLTVELLAEFRTPRARTFALPAFSDGGKRLIIRFTPTEPGAWTFKLSSNLARINEQKGGITATEATTPGFVTPQNVHHWQSTGDKLAHLWMGAKLPGDTLPSTALLDSLAAHKFTHVGLTLNLSGFGVRGRGQAVPDEGTFKALDAALQAINSRGMVADLSLGDPTPLLAALPDRADRERLFRYLLARYTAYNLTWRGIERWEEVRLAREFLQEWGGFLKQRDPYQHPRSAGAVITSAPLLGDGWMNYRVYGTPDENVASIEQQLFGNPAIQEGLSAAQSIDTLRKQLWVTSLAGHYPVLQLTGQGDNAALALCKVWFEFMAGNRHWELEPFFEVDGGRGSALPGVEHVIYVEQPQGPVEVRVEKRGYDVAWINPSTGERIPQKEWKGDAFVGEAPSKSRDWILHLSREGSKQGMLKSWKFESRRILLQEVDNVTKTLPFSVTEPSAPDLQVGKAYPYQAKKTRDSRATRNLLYLWTGEVTADGQGYRILGTGASGQLRVPKEIVKTVPGALSLRIYGMNANGKVYAIDKVYGLVQ